LCGLFLDPWQQLVLDGLLQRRQDGLWVTKNGLLIVPRQNGKGAVIEAWELARLFLFGERDVLHTAHHDRTVRDGFTKMVNRIQASPLLSDRLMQDRSRGVRVANGQRSITFNTGQQLTYATRSSGAGRGQTLDAVVLDEVQHLDDEELESLSSTISTKPFGQIMMAGSAPVPGKSESLRRLVATGRSGSDRMTYFEWSLDENVQHDLDDPANWAQANPGYGFRLFDGPFHSDRVLLTEDGFAREHLGIVEVENSGVFPGGAWDALYSDDPTIKGAAVYGVAVSEDREWACVAVAGDRPDGLTHVEYGAYKATPIWVAEYLAELASRRPVRVVVRPNSEAGSLISDLEARKIDVIRASQSDYAHFCGNLLDSVAQKRDLRHSGQAALDVAVRAARKRRHGDAFVWEQRNPHTDISPLEAVTLAFGVSRRKTRSGKLLIL
jgi:hypothetical protein